MKWKVVIEFELPEHYKYVSNFSKLEMVDNIKKALKLANLVRSITDDKSDFYTRVLQGTITIED